MSLVGDAGDDHSAFELLSQNPALNGFDNPVAMKLGVAGTGLLRSERKHAVQIQPPMSTRRSHGQQEHWVFVLRPNVKLWRADEGFQRDAMERHCRAIKKRQRRLVVRKGYYPVSPERPNPIGGHVR